MNNQKQDPELSPKKGKSASPLKSFVRFSGMGLQMVVYILAGYWVGKQIGHFLGSDSQLWLIGGTFFGVIGSMAYIIAQVKNLNK
ncbi:AtpZ/AtpI family protein [Persicobacter psychrovividus]|uniref:AtpZ/AtpI family protein n=1 Tax=Persicobacter psychrovividus TaxID=387638 RepID=UPI003BA976D2